MNEKWARYATRVGQLNGSGRRFVEVIKMASATRCIKRPETPDDLTGTIVFLSSDDSDFITGQTIIVDGGSALN
ncbi:MAG: SDR family oxidoreductase [Syntrophorhabdales bacterium]|jgi:NAD(P)-dependent dehydrogenase (short-subunit alcohol dehydrogenase family)